ncbi:GreA/GreB family elongation factor [Deinococcus sp.]|uniref:GreA/GreB family elongation factor n=1 Tax=Deinococcus sp. TaxID=47478 RepID=UPI00286E5506|nr:GreA/GreB family elongation factor [Deinococcus sp.]
MAKEIKLTREGFERLQAILETEKARLEEATRVLQEQMETSTDAEDTGLEDAKREKMNIEARIDELEDTLTRAQLVEGKGAEGRVSLGTVVILHNEATKKDMRVQVVSAPEAGVLGGNLPRISDDSPVGLQLIGRKSGESFVVNLDNGKQMKYRVVSVE